jgi:hypothetical protein
MGVLLFSPTHFKKKDKKKGRDRKRGVEKEK